MGTLEQIRTKLQANPVAIQFPIGAEEGFEGVVDLVAMKAIRYKDETLGAESFIEDIPEDYRAAGNRVARAAHREGGGS